MVSVVYYYGRRKRYTLNPLLVIKAQIAGGTAK